MFCAYALPEFNGFEWPIVQFCFVSKIICFIKQLIKYTNSSFFYFSKYAQANACQHCTEHVPQKHINMINKVLGVFT